MVIVVERQYGVVVTQNGVGFLGPGFGGENDGEGHQDCGKETLIHIVFIIIR
jgi:hypothetical protein